MRHGLTLLYLPASVLPSLYFSRYYQSSDSTVNLLLGTVKEIF